MAKEPANKANHESEHHDVPELDDVVEPVTPKETPPPNFDLFADAGIDRETLKAEIRQALDGELEDVMADVRHALAEAIAQSVDASLETRIRRRLPELLDRIFTEIEASRSGKD